MDYSLVYGDYDSFYNYLKKNYNKALDNLQYFDYSELYFNEIREDLSEKISELLINNGFVLNSRNIGIIDYNPLFLICSLKNNYINTIDCIVKEKDKVKYIPSFDIENKVLEEILINKEFILSSKNLDVLRTSSCFLIASLKNDFDKTIRVLNRSKVNAVYMSDKQVEELISIIFYDKKISFKKLPVALKNILVTYIYNNENNAYVSYLVNNKLIPITYFPSDTICFNDNILKAGCNSEQEYEYLRVKLGDYASNRYEKEDEEKFLDILSGKYKHCECVEDVIKEMYNKKMKREDMSLMEIFAFNLYASKILKRNNISTGVEILGFDYGMDKYGVQTERGITLFINGDVNTVEDLVGTLNHEIEHIIQKENIRKCKIDLDHDIDLYSKDFILSSVLEDYYKDNMNSISFEYDAEFKSNIRTARVLGLVNDVDYEKMDINELFFNKRELICYASDRVMDTEYSYDMYRRRGIHTENLEDLFERTMFWLRRGDISKYYEVLNDYPIIKYEYNYADTFERKSIKELVDCLDKCNNHDKGIYFNLLRSRLEEEKNEDYEDNLEELENLLNDNSYSEKTRLIIDKLVCKANHMTNSKYNGYINRINGHRI